VAHDFNNILGAVLGYGELAQSSVPPNSAVRRYVDSMMSAGQRAKSLVERILAFSRSAETIAGLGYEAVGFSSAVEALEAFRSDPQRFDAVLSDETMPGMTGSQLTEKIIAIRPDIPVILMSGYAGPTLVARA